MTPRGHVTSLRRLRPAELWRCCGCKPRWEGGFLTQHTQGQASQRDPHGVAPLQVVGVDAGQHAQAWGQEKQRCGAAGTTGWGLSALGGLSAHWGAPAAPTLLVQRGGGVWHRGRCSVHPCGWLFITEARQGQLMQSLRCS